jgi:cytochrome c5
VPKRKFNKILSTLIIILSVVAPIVAYAALSGSLSEDAIRARLAPEGKVNILKDASLGDQAAAPAAQQAGGPAKIYEANCKMCHASGLAGAPKLHNKADWAPRLAEGMDVVVKKAMQGFKAMPPKGNCISCSEDDIKNTIKYMTETLQ